MKKNTKKVYCTLHDKAIEIYESLPYHEKGSFTSSAIIEKHDREKGTSIEKRVEALENMFKELESRMEK